MLVIFAGVQEKNGRFPVIIAATHIPELKEFRVTDNGIEVGASVTFSDLEKLLKKVVEDKPGMLTKYITKCMAVRIECEENKMLL